MPNSYDLSQLDPSSFEHLVNSLAIQVLGPGHASFGPGSDGGRDGYFEGSAPYPSESEHWSGRWYIQSKFHAPHLSKDPQKWLLEQIEAELRAFKATAGNRVWPDNWIVASNIDPSGVPVTGTFDSARALVQAANPKLADRFHIWGGSKILDFLSQHIDVAERYGHFLTPGHLIANLVRQLQDVNAEVNSIIRYLVVDQFVDQQYAKLEQAGPPTDIRPGIHHLFIDLPMVAREHNFSGMITTQLVKASSMCHSQERVEPDGRNWKRWRRHPRRARVWFVKGGPGQGKSTVGQYFSQIQRAALILAEDGPPVSAGQRDVAAEVKEAAEAAGFWPKVPRIPVLIELKEFAGWYSRQSANQSRGIRSYLAHRMSQAVEQPVLVGTLSRALRLHPWVVLFDGLDEVPHDVKDNVAAAVTHFVDNVAIAANSDMLVLCTSRPQGYSGQFSVLEAAEVELTNLTPEQALRAAKPVIELARSPAESKEKIAILNDAMLSGSVRELMTSPLQAHIMAVVVRDGGKPPDRRWQLFNNFYEVIRKREANRNLPDQKLAKLLREDEQLLKTVHSRLGFVLHARAETSDGAQTRLKQSEFRQLVVSAAHQMLDENVQETVEILMQATTERLVLVSTPDDGDHVRFDIRPLQEFFAAEFLYESIDAERLRRRIEVVGGDSHWREVMHFLLSALVENNRRTELTVITSVLNTMNEGTDNQDDVRILNRRLARGALLTARLLGEGVLEQDKRVREQFKPCIQPLAATTEFAVVRLLKQVTQPNSLAWMHNVLVETLYEASISENCGAAIVIGATLLDADVRTESVIPYILKSPPDYVAEFLWMVANLVLPEAFLDELESVEKQRVNVSDWVVSTSIQALIGANWQSLGVRGISAAIRIITHGWDRVSSVAERLDLREDQLMLLHALVDSEDENREHEAIELGLLRICHFTHDWTTVSCPTQWTSITRDASTVDGGILLLVRLLVTFAQSRTASVLAGLLELIEKLGWEVLEVLPPRLKAFIPLNPGVPTSEQLRELRQMDEKELCALLDPHKEGKQHMLRPCRSLALMSGCKSRNLEPVVQQFPLLALRLLFDSDVGISNDWPSDETNMIMNMIVEKFINSPELLSSIPDLWGRLLEAAPQREEELRASFAQAHPTAVQINLWTVDLHPFRLRLPQEAKLLPYVLAAAIADLDAGRSRPEEQLANIRTTILGYVEEQTLLDQIARDQTASRKVRCAALIMWLMHPGSHGDLVLKEPLLLEMLDDPVDLLYLHGITIAVTLLSSEEDRTARVLVGKLLARVRTNFEARSQLSDLLALWREASHAPVSRAGLQDRWLSGQE